MFVVGIFVLYKECMPRLISALVLLIFFIWILPLGVFIKPSQEEKACNGQRAICLCSHLIAKQKDARVAKIMLTNPGAQKEANPSGGASHDFIVDQKRIIPDLALAKRLLYDSLPDQSTFSINIDHVLKA